MSRSYQYFESISVKTRFLNFFRRMFRHTLFENWLIKKTSGRSVGTFWAKFVPPEYLYNQNSLRIVNRRGAKYTLDISDTVDHFIYFDFADRAFDKLMSIVRIDSVVVDIGANVGRFSLPFASI
jgi:hypothetical protein